MTPDQARKLLLQEAFGEDGVIVQIRMGVDPGTLRMQALIAATKTLGKALVKQNTIDRELAYGLFTLAKYLEQNVGSWAEHGHSWRPDLIEIELPNLLAGIESIFADESIDFVEVRQ